MKFVKMLILTLMLGLVHMSFAGTININNICFGEKMVLGYSMSANKKNTVIIDGLKKSTVYSVELAGPNICNSSIQISYSNSINVFKMLYLNGKLILIFGITGTSFFSMTSSATVDITAALSDKNTIEIKDIVPIIEDNDVQDVIKSIIKNTNNK